MTSGGRILVLVLVLSASALGAGACGRIGPLDQPPPLFGARAKADYYAQRQQQAQAAADRSAATRQNQQGSAERTPQDPTDATTNVTGNSTGTGDPNADDAPLTTRDIKDPNQVLTSPRDSPVPGAPDSLGPTPDLSPHKA